MQKPGLTVMKNKEKLGYVDVRQTGTATVTVLSNMDIHMFPANSMLVKDDDHVSDIIHPRQ